MGALIGYAVWEAALLVTMFALPSSHAVTWSLVGLSGVVAMLVGVARNRPDARTPWLLLAAASLLDIAAHLVQVVITGRMLPPPVPSIAALLFLAALPFHIIGLLAFIRARGPVPDRRMAVDALIITLALTLLAWVFLIRPYQMDPSYSVLVRALVSFYAVGDVVILGVLVRLFMPTMQRGAAAWLVSVGIVAALLSDIATGLVYDFGWSHQTQLVSAGWATLLRLLGRGRTAPGHGRHDQFAPLRQGEGGPVAAGPAGQAGFPDDRGAHRADLPVRQVPSPSRRRRGHRGRGRRAAVPARAEPPAGDEPGAPPEPDQGADAAGGGGGPGVGGHHRGDRDGGTGRDRRPPAPRPAAGGNIPRP